MNAAAGFPDAAPGHVAHCIEAVARGETAGPEPDCPTWAPYALIHFAKLAGVPVDVDWEPKTRTMTARPPETPAEREAREDERRRAGRCQRSRHCDRPLAQGHARLCAPCLAVQRGFFGRETDR